MYAALIVPALPVAMANMAVEKQRDRAHLNETWRLLQANDPPRLPIAPWVAICRSG